jgi:hypothetical protein
MVVNKPVNRRNNMDIDKIKKHADLIRDCFSKQNEIYRILGKHSLGDEIENSLRIDAEEYQKIIDKETKILRKYFI